MSSYHVVLSDQDSASTSTTPQRQPETPSQPPLPNIDNTTRRCHCVLQINSASVCIIWRGTPSNVKEANVAAHWLLQVSTLVPTMKNDDTSTTTIAVSQHMQTKRVRYRCLMHSHDKLVAGVPIHPRNASSASRACWLLEAAEAGIFSRPEVTHWRRFNSQCHLRL